MFKIVYVIDGKDPNNEVFCVREDAENAFYFMVHNPQCVSVIWFDEDKVVQAYYVNKAVPMGGWSEGQFAFFAPECEA